MAMIEVRSLCKSYGRKQVLAGVSFCVEEGQCVGIAGANGCGKSTLLSVMAGAARADSGQLLYQGKPAGRKELFAVSGYVPQGNPLMPELSVKDNLRLWFRGGTKEWKEAKQSGLISMLGLDRLWKTPAENLSGGMKRRLTLACALLNRPRLLILDEPGAALDIVCKEDILRYLTAYMEEGGTVLLASHEEGELALCGRLLLMEGGRVRETEAGLGLSQLAEMLKGRE